jgi:uncharacterized membrane protein
MESTIFQSPQRAKKIGETERVLSAVGGGLLLGFSLLAPGKSRLPMIAAGGLLLLRGVTGYSYLYRLLNIYRAQDRLNSGIRVERAVTINRPVEEVYAFWRDLENLPRFMKNLRSVTVRESKSHWVAEAPLGMTVEWDAVVEQDQPGSKISWRSTPDSQIENAGVVMFQPAPGGRGTEVRVHLEYKAPGGSLGAALARILGDEPDIQIREDLRRLKMLLETGQIITVKGQTSGRGVQQFGW